MSRTRVSLARYLAYSPRMGFSSQVMVHKGKGPNKKSTLRKIELGGICREETIWNTRAKLANLIFNWEVRGPSVVWGNSYGTRVASLDLDAPETKQPGTSYLYMNSISIPGGSNVSRGRAIELLDAVVGCTGVVANPDRYQGNWWTTSLGESKRPKGSLGIRWYGIDNSILRHPVLMAIYLGLFRQVCLLESQGFGAAMATKIKREDVEKALTEADPDRSIKILRKIRPWLELGKSSRAVPFPKGHWNRLESLYKALLKHSYDEVFSGGVEKGWVLPSSNKPFFRHGSGVATGVFSYWGASTNTNASKRLAKLGE